MTSFHPPLSFSKAPGPEAAAEASCVLVVVMEVEECGCCWRFQRGEEEAVEVEGGRMTKAVWV